MMSSAVRVQVKAAGFSFQPMRPPVDGVDQAVDAVEDTLAEAEGGDLVEPALARLSQLLLSG